MSTLTINYYDNNGLELTTNLVQADSGGDSFPNDGKVWLYVLNGEAAPVTVKVVPKSTAGCNMEYKQIDVTVTNGADKIIGPFPTSCYDRTVQITYTGTITTLLEIGAFRGK